MPSAMDPNVDWAANDQAIMRLRSLVALPPFCIPETQTPLSFPPQDPMASSYSDATDLKRIVVLLPSAAAASVSDSLHAILLHGVG